MHFPVLLHEVIEGLDPKQGEFFIDGTIGGGGHAREILARIGDQGTLLGVDRDPRMIEALTEEWGNRKNVILVCGSYADVPEILASCHESSVMSHGARADGLLLDLGFSSEQLAGSGRGFSFNADEPLRMTYADDAAPVAELLRGMKEDELARIIREFGGERMAGRIARAIAERERRKPITRTGELAEIVRNAVPRGYERGRIDPATRTFQALRIYANKELEHLERALSALPEILKRRGRAAIISFHSLEDRIVKTKFKSLEKEGKLEIITKKPVGPSKEELSGNPRSRSAKLRVARMI